MILQRGDLLPRSQFPEVDGRIPLPLRSGRPTRRTRGVGRRERKQPDRGGSRQVGTGTSPHPSPSAPSANSPADGPPVRWGEPPSVSRSARSDASRETTVPGRSLGPSQAASVFRRTFARLRAPERGAEPPAAPRWVRTGAARPGEVVEPLRTGGPLVLRARRRGRVPPRWGDRGGVPGKASDAVGPLNGGHPLKSSSVFGQTGPDSRSEYPAKAYGFHSIIPGHHPETQDEPVTYRGDQRRDSKESFGSASKWVDKKFGTPEL